jgi:probable phosphoglycerate mutase
MQTTELLIVRHGETPWNTEKRIQGWRDIALNATGQQQAQQLAEHLHRHHNDGQQIIHGIYSSDLARAKETAAAVAQRLNLPMTLDSGIRERNYGVLEGVLFHKMHEQHPEIADIWASREPDGIIPGAETLRAFHARVGQAIALIATKHVGERIVIVTHGGAMDILWRIATGSDIRAPRNAPLLNASVNRIQATHAHPSIEWSLLEWGNVAHLKQSGHDITAG